MRRRAAAAGLALLAACASRRARAPSEPPYDLLIVNARVVDGTGNPWYYGDLATRGDRIAGIGAGLRGALARRVIDARGLVVAPGFIDMLGHSELSILSHPTAISKITQGITSEITGEVDSPWPTVGPEPRWSSLAGYFDFVDRQGIAINLGTYVAAGSVRRAVMGDASRHPTTDEMARMGALIDSAMRDGAVGFSTGLIYPPSTFFSTAELTELATHAGKLGGGYASHIRNEGDGLLDAIREAIAIGHGAGTWIEIRHLKSHSDTLMVRAIALIDSARRAGIDVTADQYPYAASGTGLATMLPAWAQAGGTDSMLARLRDPATRKRIRGDPGPRGAGSDFARTTMILPRADSLRKYAAKRLEEVGRMRHQDPVEAAYDILLADSGTTGVMYFTWSEEALRRVMRQPWVSVGQDAGATSPDTSGAATGHPRAFGSFPRILGRYVRQDSVLTLEEAIRKMTSLAAQRVGLHERGVLARGHYADIVVFDPATIIDRATYEAPHQIAAGVRFVTVNGVLVIDEGRVTGALPGRALRGVAARQ